MYQVFITFYTLNTWFPYKKYQLKLRVTAMWILFSLPSDIYKDMIFSSQISHENFTCTFMIFFT